MAVLLHYFVLSAPMFGMVLLGYALARSPWWRPVWTKWCSRFVFAVSLPALLFVLLSRLATLAPTDPRLLIAYFGGCLSVFLFGRRVAGSLFGLDGAGQSVFAMGGVFSNNVLLGVPLAQAAFGAVSLPSVALVTAFNSLTLWTLVSVSVEWARNSPSRALSAAALAKTALSVLKNPIVASILAGTLFGYSRLHMPAWVATPLMWLGRPAGPVALLVLGLSLSAYALRENLAQSVAITLLKLVVQPLAVWSIGAWLGLPALELKVVVLLAAMSVGANVYLMALQFETAEAAVAGSLLLSTAIAALSIPLVLTLLSL
jgi:malonate transporter and related proteins